MDKITNIMFPYNLSLLSIFRVLLTALLDTDAVITGDWSDLAVPGLSLLQNFNWLELVGD